MDILSKLKAVYSFDGSNKDVELQSTRAGGLLVAHQLPPYTEAARRGRMWSVMNTTAIASLVVRPSGTAMVTLFNDEPATGKSYIIDRLFAHNLVATAASHYGLWACLHKENAEPAGADDMAAEIRSHNGKTKYAGNAIVGIGETVDDDGWFPYGEAGFTTTITTPGSSVVAAIEGRLVVPPKRSLSVTVVSTNAGGTFTSGMSWIEEQLDNE